MVSKFQSFRSRLVQKCSVKNVFLKISQNTQENTCTRVSFSVKLKKILRHRCFPVNFAKFFRTTATSCFWNFVIKIDFLEYEIYIQEKNFLVP